MEQNHWGKLLPLVAGALLTLCGAACSKQTLPPTGMVTPAVGPEGSQAISTFHLVSHSPTGRKKWEVQGETAQLLGNKIKLSPVAATSFGQVEVHLTAKRGQFERVSQNVHLEEDVVVTTADGSRLESQMLDWDQKADRATTPEPVKITRVGLTADGIGAVGYPKLKRVRLERQVTVILDDTEGRTVITCDGPMEVDYGRQKARFWRNVHVRDSKGRIDSDRLDVALDPESRQVESATFWGHVRIHHQGKVAYAHRANYWQALGQVRLVGHPKLVMTPEEAKGFEQR